MKRSTFIAALVGGAFAPSRLVAAEASEENAVYDAFDAILKAQYAYEFGTLASLIHPRALGLFRNVLSARFDQLLHYFTMESLLHVSGLSDHPKTIKLADGELFVAVCDATKERHPEFVGDPKLLHLSIQGTIFERPHLGHVLFTNSSRVQTEHTDFESVQPSVLSFQRVDRNWLLYSNILSLNITDGWWRDLAKAKASDANP